MKIRRSVLLVITIFLSGIVILINGCKKSENDSPNTTGDFSISGEVQDPITGLPIEGITIQLLDQNSRVLTEVTSDAEGKYALSNLAKGNYKIKSMSNWSYKEMIVPSLSLGQSAKSTEILLGNYVAFLPAPLYISVLTGAISGIVMDSIGNPIAKASVSISAEADSLTNGYFATTQTNDFGQFKIGVIPILSPVSYQPIPAFKIKTAKDGYVNLTKGITIEENQMIVINPFLVNKPEMGNIVYSDGFEGNFWTYTGYWHKQDNSPVFNQAFVNGFVQLPPGDNSNGSIPSVYQGNFMAWYGDSISGNFLGQYDSLQGPGTGGTGYYPNRGTLTSGPIDLSGLQEAALYFQNWFEIESVNPNQEGYDIMEVIIINDADSNMKTSLGRMNPFSDPVLDNRDAIAYTSGGFNVVPAWTLAQLDLTPFIGQKIRIRFEFSTIDALYNGFRGWFIDEVVVRDKAPANRSATQPYHPPKPRPR